MLPGSVKGKEEPKLSLYNLVSSAEGCKRRPSVNDEE